MKAHYANKPSAIEWIGLGRYYVNMEIHQITVDIEGKPVKQWECDQVTICGQPTYPSVVEALIRERYTVSDELAILRQHSSKADEFAEYNAFCETCKALAKPVFGE